jgi:Zinc carboxypeptidase
MRQFRLILVTALVLSMNAHAQTTEKFAEDWDKDHLSTLAPSNVRHEELKKYLEQLKKLGIAVNEMGRSFGNREIYQAEWGHGPLKVFMWSQMHGDEPTATSALMDMLAYLQKHRDTDWVKKIGDTMTIRAVPMLNPDGAETFQRRSWQGIDINRDALDLKTPEARLLKKLRDDWNPAIGFNLHNQGALTTVGRSSNQATIALLVVYGDAAKTTSAGHERNTRLAAAMAAALQKFIPGHISRYSGEWTPTAFGDNFSAWGTPTILVETGALQGRDEMFLIKLNFIAFMTALQALATGSEATQDTTPYLSLIENGSGGLYNFVFRDANISDSVREDIAINIQRSRSAMSQLCLIASLGDIRGGRGIEEYDASGFNVVQRFRETRVGSLGDLLFYKKDRIVDWTAADLEKQFPPDAVFSGGKWTVGEKLVPRK